MRTKIYSTYKNSRIDNALDHLRSKFGSIPGFEFSEISYIEPMERKKKWYEEVLAMAGLKLKVSKSISTEFLMSLPHDGYDCVMLFVNKDKALESGTLYGQHSRRIKDGSGRSYIEVYDDQKYVKFDKKGNYVYTSNKTGTSGETTSQTAEHEIYHAGSDEYDFADLLHVFIEEGQWKDYYHYFQHNVMEKKNTSSRAKKLFDTAMSCIGRDVTPLDEVNDMVACAASVNAVYQKAFGKPIGGGASTYNLYNAMLKSKEFLKVDSPLPGDIIISPTGYAGKGGTLSNGHVGIVSEADKIMSNTSKNGLWTSNFTLKSWNDYYVGKGKFPVHFFRPV